MASHKIYTAIVKAVTEGTLNEPFRSGDFKRACPGFANRTYGVFLAKHRRGNPQKEAELFEQVARGLYRLIRPFRYSL